MNKTIRIGLFGGAFDPIHWGHIRMIREVLAEFPLDRVILIPAGAPPHKLASVVAPAGVRLAMTQAATANEGERIMVSDIEAQRQGASFTIDTVQSFLRSAAANDHFFLLLGLDAMLEIDTWKHFETLLRLIDFIVMARPGIGPADDAHGAPEPLADFLSSRISAAYHFSPAESAFIHPQHPRIYYFRGSHIRISSTQIRDRIKKRLPIAHLVPEPVKTLIMQKGLYL